MFVPSPKCSSGVRSRRGLDREAREPLPNRPGGRVVLRGSQSCGPSWSRRHASSPSTPFACRDPRRGAPLQEGRPHAHHRRRGAARLAVVVALVALVASGCGGGAKTSDPQANPTQTKGLERQSPAQVQPGCRRDPQGRQSVHVTGTAINNGKPVRVDLRIQSNASSGTMELHGVKLEFITTGHHLPQGRPADLGDAGCPRWLGRLADRWVKTGPRRAAGLTRLLPRQPRRPADEG